MKKINVFGFISRITLLTICLLSMSHISFAQVAATYGSQGLATLSFNGVKLVDTNTNPGDAFRVDTYERMLNNNPATLDENGIAHTSVWDAVNHIITWNYIWGSVSCQYATTASQLNMTITVNNTTSTDTINGVQLGHNIRFPNTPLGFPGFSILSSNTEYPGVTIADYGSGLVDVCSVDVARPLYSGLKIINNPSNIYEILFASQSYSNRFVGDPIISDPIAPNQSRSYTLSLRFANSGPNGHTLATDIYQAYATVHPFQVTLRDKRPIGEINSTKAGFASATNPEAYRLRGQAIDVTNHAGLVAFRAQALAFADDLIAQLQARNAQGMIIWDMEGQKYPQSITYIGDPSMIDTLSPEMAFDDGSGVKTIDAFFKKFTDLGFKVGCTLRPQHLVLGVGGDSGDGVTRGALDGTNATQVDYATPADAIVGINAKVQYAKSRWGCTLFYIDSTVHNPDVLGNPTPQPSDRSKLDPSIFEALQAMNPDCFFLIEEHDTRNQASVAGYLDLSKAGTTGGTAADIYSTYPNALSVCYVGNITPANLNTISAGITASVGKGDILLFHGWFDDEPNNGTVNSIYNAAYPTPVITSSFTATGTVNSPFTYQITATNSPYTYAAPGLPAGLQLDANTGLISGTPTAAAAGTTNVQITATNPANLGSHNLAISITPIAPGITSANTATGSVNVPFSYQITATNNPTSFDATGLPSPLTVDTTTGIISGTPTTIAVTAVMISATNAGGTGQATLTITINPAPPVITSANTATGSVNVPFSYQITATNNPTSFDATGLPSPLTVDTTTGIISGTPTTIAVTPMTISATNAGGTSSHLLTITINPTPPTINSPDTATGTIGVAFSYQITATNSPTSFGATGLPSPLTVNTTTGIISGTPTAAAVTPVTISATNAGGTGSTTLTITINPPAPVINSANTASGSTGAAFSYQITATNTPTSFGATGLPAGLIVDTTTGIISGIPLNVGSTPATISATNAGGTGSATLTITIGALAPTINSPATASGTTDAAFSYQITATNTPTSFGATGLPAGLIVDTTTGIISGTPIKVGVTAASISATNGGGTATAALTITISTPPATYHFSAGLNLISLPYDYPGVPLDTIFGYSGVKMAVWQPSVLQYALTPTLPADQIRAGGGYWVRFPHDVDVTLTGTPPDPTTSFSISLSQGWNQIGDPFLKSVALQNLSISKGAQTFDFATATGSRHLIFGTLYDYKTSAGQYEAASALNPTVGYWIYAYQAVTLQVPGPSASLSGIAHSKVSKLTVGRYSH